MTHSKCTNALIYPTFKIAVLDEILSGEGVKTEQLLAGTQIKPESIHQSETRVSRQQLISIYKNAQKLSTDPGRLALLAGVKLRLATYGMYGFAMMTSPDFRYALDFSIRYHQLASPTVLMSLSVDDDDELAIMRFDDVLNEPSLSVFNLDLQFSLVQSLMRDMVGTELCFESISATFSAPKHEALYEEIFGCRVNFKQATNEVRFKEWWLRQPLRNASTVTADLTRKFCDESLATMRPHQTTAEAVNALLSQNPREFHSLERVARKLNVSSRTLRRRLTDENASFHQMQREARKRYAIAYLRETRMSIEDIADQLGFSDAANFRRAFKQWTGQAPSHYR